MPAAFHGRRVIEQPLVALLAIFASPRRLPASL